MRASINLRIAGFLGAALILILLGLVLFRNSSIPLGTALLGASIMAAGLIPCILLLGTPPEDRTSFPLLPLTGLFYAFFFGFPVFLSHLLRTGINDEIKIYRDSGFSDISAESQILILIGLGLLYFGYSLIKFLARNCKVTLYKFNLNADEPITRGLAWVLLVSHLGYLLIPFVSSLPSVGQFLQPAGFLALGIFYVIWRHEKLPNADKLLLLIFAPLLATHYVTATFLTPILMMIVLLLALELWISGRLPWGSIIITILIFVLAYPLFTPIRNSLTAPSSNLAEKLILTSKALKEEGPKYFSGEIETYKGFTIRIGHIFVFSRVVSLTPEKIPYWDGETYKPIFTSFIPRAIWLDKPRETAGAAFGERFRFLESNDSTSVNIPWITEMYVNFGRLGLITGMTLVGLLIAILETVCCHRRQGHIGVVVGASLCLPVFYQESNFSVMMGSFIPLAVCFWLYFRVAMILKSNS